MQLKITHIYTLTEGKKIFVDMLTSSIKPKGADHAVHLLILANALLICINIHLTNAPCPVFSLQLPICFYLTMGMQIFLAVLSSTH